MAQEIDKYGTPRTLSPLRQQELSNQTGAYVQGAEAAARTRADEFNKALVPNEQTIRPVANPNPGVPSGAGDRGGSPGAAGGVAGSATGGLRAVGDTLAQAFPGVTATLRGTGEDLSNLVNKGQYARAATRLGINTFGMLPMAAADDVVGGAFRALKPVGSSVVDEVRGAPVAASQPTPLPGAAPSPLRPTPPVAQVPGAQPKRPETAAAPDPGLRGFTETSTGSGIFRKGNEFSDRAGIDDTRFAARGPISQQNQDAAQNLSDRYAADTRNKFQYEAEVADANRRNAIGAAISASERTRSSEAAARNAAMDERNAMQRQPGEKRSAYATRIRAMTETRGQDLSERQSVRGDGTTRRGQDMTTATTLRGQDITSRGQDLNYDSAVRGQDMTAATARTSALRDQFNKDREFGLNMSKEARAARQDGEKVVMDRITGMLPLTGDPAKDGPMKAQAMTALTQQFGQEIKGMRDYLAKNPGDKQTAARLKSLEDGGIAAYAGNEEGMARFMAGMQTAAAAQASDKWWNPFSATASPSAKPVTSYTVKPPLLWGQGTAVTDRKLPNGKNEEIPMADMPFDARNLLRQP